MELETNTNNKKVIIIITIAIVLVLLLATVIFLVTSRGKLQDNSPTTTNISNPAITKPQDTPVTPETNNSSTLIDPADLELERNTPQQTPEMSDPELADPADANAPPV